MLKKEYKTQSFEETRKIGEKMVEVLDRSRIFALFGDLGSGKTTFTQGFAKALGIKTKIISPTFIIARSYRINFGKFRRFYHIDLYRVENAGDLIDLGVEEIMSDEENIVVIEWPEKLEKIEKKCLKIRFEYIDINKRKIIYYE